jgi:hypothetical protein
MVIGQYSLTPKKHPNHKSIFHTTEQAKCGFSSSPVFIVIAIVMHKLDSYFLQMCILLRHKKLPWNNKTSKTNTTLKGHV